MQPYHQDESVTLYQGDATAVSRELPDGSVDCIVTSPPYFGLRDYGIEGQYGLEASPSEYVEKMTELFSELRRVLSDDGTLWLNIGDSYKSTGGKHGVGPNASVGATLLQSRNRTRPKANVPNKNLLGIPWRLAFGLQDDGWILRNDIIWEKPNGMPESVRDRCSNRYEHIFMFSKSKNYSFDLDALRNQSGGTGDVWKINTKPFKEAHFAVFPPELPSRCITAGCKTGGVVLDPFSGSGTTGLAALGSGRSYVGIELNSEYIDLSLRTRLANRFLQTVTYDVP